MLYHYHLSLCFIWNSLTLDRWITELIQIPIYVKVNNACTCFDHRSRDEPSSDLGLTPEFRKLLECPACEEVGFPPIYLCAKGHSLCHRCHELLSTCPKCSAPITSMRNEMAESIVAKFTFKCPYSTAGCLLITDGGTIGKHLPGCDFRFVDWLRSYHGEWIIATF